MCKLHGFENYIGRAAASSCEATFCGLASGGDIPLRWAPDLRGLMAPLVAEAELRLLSIRGQVGKLHRDGRVSTKY